MPPEDPPIVLRLQLPDGWVTLPSGQYEIGRLSSCHLVLEGPKVSRLHARVVVAAAQAVVEDLGSANGVFLNGKRVPSGRQPLRDGDSLVIGDFAMSVAIGRGPMTAQRPLASEERATLGSATVTGALPANAATGKAMALDLLASVAERAIAAGDARRAEGIVQARMQEFLDGVQHGAGCDAAVRDRVLRLALGLAQALGSTEWLGYSLDFLAATATLPSETQLVQIEAAATKIRYADVKKLRDYLRVARDLVPSAHRSRVVGQLETLIAAVGR